MKSRICLKFLFCVNLAVAQCDPVYLITGDSSNSDLQPLRSILSDKNIVLLGEPTHGEGNVFEEKTRLVKFLHEELNFGILAFESGFFELNKAQNEISAGLPVEDCLEKSLFPVWTESDQFCSLVSFIKKTKNRIRIVGFDNQLTGSYCLGIVDDLSAYLQNLSINIKVDWQALRNEIEFVCSNYRVNDFSTTNAIITDIIDKLSKAKLSNVNEKRDRDFWIQCLKSLRALLTDYHTNDPSAKTQDSFKASDSNSRDRQMAENLLFLAAQYPNEKIICWGATLHFANDVTRLGNEELMDYQPMGQWVKNIYKEKAYIIGFTGYDGQYGSVFQNPTDVPRPPDNSIEAYLTSKGITSAFIDLQQCNAKFTMSAFDYTPLHGDWSKVLDGIFFIKTITPSTKTDSK